MIATLATLLSRREQLHSNRLKQAISLYSPETQQRIDQLTQFFLSRGDGLSSARDQVIKAIDNIVHREADVMADNDCFYFIGISLNRVWYCPAVL